MSHTNSLYTLNEAGAPIPATADEIIAAAREHISRRVRRGTSLPSPEATRDYLTLKLGTREFETFCCLFLDARFRVIDFVELFRGTVDGASVHPREVVKEALKRNAAAVIFAHPHPSGVAEPSAADELITRRLRDALQLVDIRVLDHLLGGLRCVTGGRKSAEILQSCAVKHIGASPTSAGDSLRRKICGKRGGFACACDATPSCSPSRPCARRFAPCSASRAGPEPVTAALRWGPPASGNPARARPERRTCRATIFLSIVPMARSSLPRARIF